jgi:hypothetical protein
MKNKNPSCSAFVHRWVLLLPLVLQLPSFSILLSEFANRRFCRFISESSNFSKTKNFWLSKHRHPRRPSKVGSDRSLSSKFGSPCIEPIFASSVQSGNLSTSDKKVGFGSLGLFWTISVTVDLIIYKEVLQMKPS